MTTKLVKVTGCNGGGLLSLLHLISHKGERISIQRNTISDDDVEKMKKDWAFVSFTHKYIKHVQCDFKIAHKIIDDEHKRNLTKFMTRLRAERDVYVKTVVKSDVGDRAGTTTISPTPTQNTQNTHK